jgi:hypothetical protein
MSFLCLLVLLASEGPFFADWPLDGTIPDARKVLGYQFGERIAMHYEALAYAEALAAASDNVRLIRHGATWEGRPMALLLVSSPANLKAMEEIRGCYQELSDPRITSRARLAEIQAKTPVCVWLNESVHGNETSGTDSGLLLAYQLAAGSGGEAARLREEVLLIIEICQNPDGRDRWITFSRFAQSPHGSEDPNAAEHRMGWPSGRLNHYLFDMNRDWFAMTQEETRAKVHSFLQWYPQVVIDLHEMGSESSFFAAAPAPPANPLLPAAMLQHYAEFGRSIGRLFDQQGWFYFHSEVFDSFYPGYGESWPSLHGSIGMLFEQGSVAGLRYRKKDGELIHYRQAVSQQAHASLAVLRHAAAKRAALLEFFYTYREEATQLGREGEFRTLALPPETSGRSLALASLLRAQGIEVHQLEETYRGVNGLLLPSLETGKADLPVGTLLISFAQPAGRLARSLLLPDLKLDSEFLARQEKRRNQRYESEIYDVTGWSLPLAYNVPGLLCGTWKAHTSIWQPGAPGSATLPPASLGYLIARSDETYPLISELLLLGTRLRVAFQPVKLPDQAPLASAFFVARRDLHPEAAGSLQRWLSQHPGRSILPLEEGWLGEPGGLGSQSFAPLPAPRVAMLWGAATYPLSTGWMRYTMEQVFHYPVTPLETESLDEAKLADYQVLLMPAGSYGVLDPALIKRWVERGGVLVCVAEATDWALEEKVGLLLSARELSSGELPREDAPPHPEKLESDPQAMLQPLQESPRAIPGALVRALLDENHWLALGSSSQVAVMVDSDRVLRPLRLNQGQTVGRYAGESALTLSGFVPEESRKQLANKAFLMVQDHGRGRVIAFAEDPNFRGFLRGLTPLFYNAALLGPSSLLVDP